MKLTYDPLLTAHAENHAPDTFDLRVYADEAFIVERWPVPRYSVWECRLVVKRRDRKPIGDRRTLQDAKNQVAGAERFACQLLPPEAEVTDKANLYHLRVALAECPMPAKIVP
jgi:hypothetical protein